jgi:hypothetical protein
VAAARVAPGERVIDTAFFDDVSPTEARAIRPGLRVDTGASGRGWWEGVRRRVRSRSSTLASAGFGVRKNRAEFLELPELPAGRDDHVHGSVSLAWKLVDEDGVTGASHWPRAPGARADRRPPSSAPARAPPRGRSSRRRARIVSMSFGDVTSRT